MSKESQAMHLRAPLQSFPYPAIAPSGRTQETLALGAAGPRPADDSMFQQELAAAVAAAREKAFHDGQAQANAAATKTIEQERRAIAAAIQSFGHERAEYFQKVEREAVRLAMAIARKVLHREAQMDPLLLAGIVRVALDQIQQGTRLELRVSADSASSWAEFSSAHLANGNAVVTVVADDRLKDGACILQAEAGTTEISVESQLEEIERGFFDRMREATADRL